MASFDPSVIASIGQNGPDIMGSIGKAYTLKDLIDSEQLSSLRLNQTRRELADKDTARDILSKADLSSSEGIAKASEELTRAGQPDAAMKLRRDTQQVQSGELELQLNQVKLDEVSHNLVAEGLDRIWSAATQLKNARTPDGRPRYTDDMVNRYVQSQVDLELSSLQSDPALPAQVKQVALQRINQKLNALKQSGTPFTYDVLTQLEQQSNVGQAHLKSQREDLQARLGMANTEDEMRHRQVEERQAQDRIDLERQKAQTAGFTSAQSRLLGAISDAGVRLPAGLRSQAQIKATLDGLMDRHPDETFDEIAAGLKSGAYQFAAEMKAGQVAGAQVGRVSLAVNELEPFGRQVLDASKDLPRASQSLTINGLMQAGEKELNNPALLRLKVKLNALNNAYDQLAARGGGTDKDKRAHIHELFDARLTDENIRTLVTAISEEGAGAKEAAKRTIAETSGAKSDTAGTGGQGGKGGQPPPQALSRLREGTVTTFGNGQKWTLQNGKPVQVQ